MNLSLFNVNYPAVFVQNTLRDLKNAKRQAAMPTRPRASQANQRKEEEEEQEEEEEKEERQQQQQQEEEEEEEQQQQQEERSDRQKRGLFETACRA